MRLPKATFQDLRLFDDKIDARPGALVRHSNVGGPLPGCEAAVILGADDRHLTATRIVLLGPLAWAKKKGRQNIYLTIEGDGWSVVRELEPKDETKARKFAAAVNRAAAVATPPTEAVTLS